jgi:hypothetical protein
MDMVLLVDETEFLSVDNVIKDIIRTAAIAASQI